jgi:prepilin peptidase CpaA
VSVTVVAGVACAAVIVAAAAAWLDVRTGRIPDLLTLTALGFGLGVAVPQGVASLAWAVLGVGIALYGCLLLATPKLWLGGGDMKLLMALGALLGPLGILLVGAGTAIIIGFSAPKIERRLGPGILVSTVGAILLKTLLSTL